MENEKRIEALKEKYALYNLTELEPVIGVSAQTMKRYIKDGKLSATKVGGKWKVSEEQLKAFLQLQ